MTLAVDWRDLEYDAKLELLARLERRAEQRRHQLRRDSWTPYPWQVPPGVIPTQGMWLMMGGRGTGKTDGCARYLSEHMDGPACNPKIPGGHRVAIIAPTLGDAVESCVDGPSGLKAHDPRVVMRQTTGGTYVRWPSGAVGKLFGAHTPDDVERLRSGGNRCLVWLEELAAMRYLQEAMDHARFGLRVGTRPHLIGSTTPKPKVALRKLLARDDVQQTHGRTGEAFHLDQSVRDALFAAYAGTRLGRQELEGELLDDVEGALWTLGMLEAPGFRVQRDEVPQLARVVVALDPAASSTDESDATGIVVAGKDYGADYAANPRRTHTSGDLDPRPHGYVLHSEAIRDLPEQRMRRVAELYHRHKADVVVIEANNGGDWIPAALRNVDPNIPVRIVHASRGKATRAQPVSGIYSQERAHHVGPASQHVQLEEQMTTWVEGEDSPDVMDALVWAFWELLVEAAPATNTDARDKRLRGRR